jgi:hypothetical protein
MLVYWRRSFLSRANKPTIRGGLNSERMRSKEFTQALCPGFHCFFIASV